MISDSKNFNIARRINWRINDLVDAFSDAAHNSHGVRFLFASDNGSVIDFVMIEFDDTFKVERIHSLIQHDFVPLGFTMRERNLSGVIYLPNYDRVRLGSWALELLQNFRDDRGDVVCSQNSFDTQERIEMTYDQRNADWSSFMTRLYDLRDPR